jgi:hypothetical protein
MISYQDSQYTKAPLRPNYSSPYAPSLVAITISDTHNIYTYSSSILWIAYGLAIGASLLSMAVGFVAAAHNGGTYSSNKFSTVLRVATNSQLWPPFAYDDTDGKEPVPEEVGEITLTFPFRDREEGDGRAKADMPQRVRGENGVVGRERRTGSYELCSQE